MRGMKLSVKLPLLIIAVVCVIMSIIGLVTGYVTRNSMRDVEMQALSDSVNAYTSAVVFYMDEAQSLLSTHADSPQLTDSSSAQFIEPALHGLPANVDMPKRNVAASLLQHSRLFEYVMLLKDDGSTYLLEPYDLQTKLQPDNFSYTAWYQILTSTGQSVISDLHISPATQRPTVVIAVPLRDSSGKLSGILAGGIKLAKLAEFGYALPVIGTAGRFGFITDNRGLVIAHQAIPKFAAEQTDFSAVPPVRAALAGEQGTMQYISPIDGLEKLAAYTPVGELGWAAVYVIPIEVAFAPINKLMLVFRLVTIFGIILIGVGSMAILRQTITPLSQLAAAAGKIGMGSLSQRVKVTTGDEIGQLATEFNQMAENLQATTVSRDTLATEVTQRKRAEEAILKLNAELAQSVAQIESVNREMEAFAYSVSHDLRSPLRGIDGWSQALLEDYKDKIDGQGQQYLSRVRSETQRMGQLIDDLLKFSRETHSEIKWQQLDMSGMAQTIASRLQQANPTHQAEYVIQPGLTAQGDYHMLEITLSNLLDNAVKFSSKNAHGKIEFGATEKEGGKVFFVRDNGVGFDMEYVHKLFGVFQRLHKSSEFPGTGIGLATVQRIINRHGGRIWAESQVNKGATFYFTLKEAA